MCISTPSVPKPDKNIGKAALMSARTGERFLEYMQGQADITNRWAEEDRARYQDTFLPLQDAYIARAQEGPDYDRVAGAVSRARADVGREFDSAQEQQSRRLASMGVNPASGRFGEASRRSELTQALATAGAANTTRVSERARAEAEADQREANALNLGSGLAVNPGTSMQISNSASRAGFSGAMQGYGQQGNLLNQDYRNRLARYDIQAKSQNSLMSGLGSIAGFAMSGGFSSSKDYKENREPAKDALETVRRLPIDEYDYKAGHGDGGHHVGPMAEDFRRETGAGNGRSIPAQDAFGLTLAAVKELDEKVEKLADTKQAPRRGGGRRMPEASA